MIDFQKLDKKWQKKWSAAKIFEADVDKKEKKFFTSGVIPYVNGSPHIGHSYTYTRSDVYTRFKRMQGFNTLFAQGWHATGEPIVGAVERLKNNDAAQISSFRTSGATDNDLEDFKKKGPAFVAQFWSRKWKENWNLMGFSIDWRREFALSITPQFSQFVEWQYNTLRKKGYVVQGTHPVVWCPKDQSPTGDHDRLQGEGESPVEYILIKFKMGDAFLPAATLRPETVFGVTNIWLNPNADYVEAQVNNEKWIVAKHAIDKIKDHIKEVRILKEFDERHQLFGRRCVNPVTGKGIPILPSEFVDATTATGVVMSVPAHAPYDYMALKHMTDKNELEAYGTAADEMQPLKLVDTLDFSGIPAKEISEKLAIASIDEKGKLDEATAQLYKKEFHGGSLNNNCGQYTGLKVSEAKERITSDMVEKNIAEIMYDVKDVVCRCTTKCHVKILENQWFLKYSDADWKEEAKKCLNRMNIYPEDARNNFSATIDWLKDKACVRKSGLGTPLPWDRSWIVETLSDSTMYMAYYTIAGIISKNKIPAGKMIPEVFDYVFLSKGRASDVAKKSKIRLPLLKKMKEEFEYFYPMDFRNSAKDLVQHHLIFYLFHHTAFWPESKWPKAISVNGYVNVEGEKMSKSRGNIIPLLQVIQEYGADLVRINIAASSEGLEDADWRTESIKSYRMRLDYIYDLLEKMDNARIKEARQIDSYLLSKMQKIIRTSTENYEVARFRTAVTAALFDGTNEIKWYLNRCGSVENANKKTLMDALSIIVRLIAPLTPHVCEEFWQMMGNKGFISVAEWPKYDEKLVDENAEKSENFIRQTLDDVREIQKMLKMKPQAVKIFLAEDWKFGVYDIVLKNKAMPMNDIVKTIMATDAKKYGSGTVIFVQNLCKKVNELRPVIDKAAQNAALNESKTFLENEIGCKLEVINADKSDDKKAKSSSPQKPGILLE